jgi:hypothetical protein
VYKTVQESDERLSREDNLAVQVRVEPLHKGGRKSGDANLSPMMRTIIGAAAKLDGPAAASKTFNVSDRQASNLALGRKTRDEAINPNAAAEVVEVAEKAKSVNEQVKEKAGSRLASLFDGPISAENISTLKPREAISAAKDLATVIDRVSPKEREFGTGVQFVIFAPRQKEEDEYETIDVTAREVD